MHTKYIMLDQGQYPINSIGYKVFLDILFPIGYDVVVLDGYGEKAFVDFYHVHFLVHKCPNIADMWRMNL